MAVRRDLRPLLAVALVGAALALAATVTGLDTGLVLLSPALVLLVPLLLGRYVGAERLARLAARARPRRRRRAVGVTLPARRPRAAGARGGRLLAFALAVRGPPATA